MRFHPIFRGLSLFFGISGTALAQTTASPQPVEWKATLSSTAPVKPGVKLTIDLSGIVQQGWHVYSLIQPSGGPIALRLSLDENHVAEILGEASGTSPIKKYDTSFGLETQLYEGDFTLHVPVELKQVSNGNQVIPLSVRFQACSDRTCLPPRTVHIAVPVNNVTGA